MSRGYQAGEPLRNRRPPPSSSTPSSPTTPAASSNGSSTRKGRSWCSSICKLLLIIQVLASLAVVVIALYFGGGVLRELNHPHSDITFNHKKHPVAQAKPPLVEPLINASTPFDIVATVWLDVTQHLDQGHSLPAGFETVTYLLPNTTVQERRTDAILYQDVLFRSVTMDSFVFGSVPLDVPIEPLYTQVLGPSSLRITFTLRPDEQTVTDLGELEGRMTIHPNTSLTLPRSLSSANAVKSRTGRLVLQDVLDHTAPSVPLLKLLPSKYYLQGDLPGFNCTGGNSSQSFSPRPLQNLSPLVPSFMDNSYASRHFVKNLTHDQDGNRYYIGDSKLCQIFHPHIRSRVNVVLLRDERHFALPDWGFRQQTAMRNSAPCWEARPEDEELPGACYDIRRNGPLEQLLQFRAKSNEGQELKMEDVAFRWSPVLYDGGPASTGPAQHQQLPHLRPGSEAALARLAAKQGACDTSILSPEAASPEFFHIDLSVHFAAHRMLRSWTLSWVEPVMPNATTAWDVEEGKHKEMINTFLPEEENYWELWTSIALGSAAHPRSKTRGAIAMGLIFGLAESLELGLALIYWYTRSNTLGLSHNAQWMIATATALSIPAQMRPWIAGIRSSPDIFYHVYWAISFLPILLVLLNIVWQIRILLRLMPVTKTSAAGGRRLLGLLSTNIVQRPESKQEYKSRMAERDLLQWWPVVSFVVVYLFTTVIPIGDRHILSGSGCYLKPSQSESGHWLFEHLFSTLPGILIGSASLTQLAFNFVSPRFAIDASRQSATSTLQRRRGNFAGTLKIAAWLAFVEQTIAIVLPRYERLGGHFLSKAPLTVEQAGTWLVSTLTFAQALVLPSVKQKAWYVDEDDEPEADEIPQNASYELIT
ncbi:hypothetical protein BCV69DRAFT_284000 [Microstroma glucosiphilum]|uniref:Uncharacterized protein n=1 Tax=Pseudomicrostroma glucosiphilum TaxID=1684307 RepID=A0A316U1Y7_9BASI|nr:hypothetical protein BCV69DRAFT_284000 [Pseudomicrostroma glucosiphilum]PWN19369.1 hypothetical protein BCV69DRAFT_284000 [Pseudomicrostroma glucosiphilum]